MQAWARCMQHALLRAPVQQASLCVHWKLRQAGWQVQLRGGQHCGSPPDRHVPQQRGRQGGQARVCGDHQGGAAGLQRPDRLHPGTPACSCTCLVGGLTPACKQGPGHSCCLRLQQDQLRSSTAYAYPLLCRKGEEHLRAPRYEGLACSACYPCLHACRSDSARECERVPGHADAAAEACCTPLRPVSGMSIFQT